MERIAFTTLVKVDQEAEYRRRHEDIWPAMVRALKMAGCSNCSKHMDGQDMFGYMEVDSFNRFKSYMSTSREAQRWEAQVAPILERAVQPETSLHKVLPEVFHLV